MHSSAFSAEFSCRSRWFLCRCCCCFCSCCCAAENKQKAKLLPLSWPVLPVHPARNRRNLFCSALAQLAPLCGKFQFSYLCSFAQSSCVCPVCAIISPFRPTTDNRQQTTSSQPIKQQPNIRNPKNQKPNSTSKFDCPAAAASRSRFPTSHISQNAINVAP